VTPYAKNDGLILAALSIPGWYEKRIEPKVHREPNGCLIWTGGTDGTYGRIRLPGTNRHGRAHRLVWIALRGPIPDGMVLDHDGPNGCRVRLCVDPDHLMVATSRQNNESGNSVTALNARKTGCPRGHSLEEANVRPRSGDRDGQRECLQCRRDLVREDQRLVSRAARSLGMRGADYRREFGQSRWTALEVLLTTAIAA